MPSLQNTVCSGLDRLGVVFKCWHKVTEARKNNLFQVLSTGGVVVQSDSPARGDGGGGSKELLKQIPPPPPATGLSKV